MVVLKEVFEFLKSSHYYKTLITLEEESGKYSANLDDDLQHVYNLVCKGEYKRLCKILSNFKEDHSDIYTESMTCLKIQEIFEKANSFKENSLDQLKEDLKQLKLLPDKNFMINLYDAAVLDSQNEYSSWEKWKGRYNCWYRLESLLKQYKGLLESCDEDSELSVSDKEDKYSESFEHDDSVVYCSDEEV